MGGDKCPVLTADCLSRRVTRTRACAARTVDAVTASPSPASLSGSVSDLDLNFEWLFTSFNPKPKCPQRADANGPQRGTPSPPGSSDGPRDDAARWPPCHCFSSV